MIFVILNDHATIKNYLLLAIVPSHNQPDLITVTIVRFGQSQLATNYTTCFSIILSVPFVGLLYS